MGRGSRDKTSSHLSIDVVRDDTVFRHCAGASAFAAARDAEEGVVRVRAERDGAHDDELFFNRRRPADEVFDGTSQSAAMGPGVSFPLLAPPRRVLSSLMSTVTKLRLAS